MAIKKINWD